MYTTNNPGGQGINSPRSKQRCSKNNGFRKPSEKLKTCIFKTKISELLDRQSKKMENSIIRYYENGDISSSGSQKKHCRISNNYPPFCRCRYSTELVQLYYQNSLGDVAGIEIIKQH